MSDGRASLQRYMDGLLAPLTAALNSLASLPADQRPADSLDALICALRAQQPLALPSKPLAALMGSTPTPTPLPRLVSQLVSTGLISLDASPSSLSPRRPPDSPCMIRAHERQQSVDSQPSDSEPAVLRSRSGKNAWQRMLLPALKKRKAEINPWTKYEVHKQATELCQRETLIKMERTSFAHGAMRECFRMKKMSQASPEGEGRGEGLSEVEMSEGRWLYAQVNAHFFYAMDWKDCNNYVAKRYISPDTSSDTYLNDIKMQMVAKHYAELYNALKPPKGVDFLHAFAIEVERKGEVSYFCVERAMEEGGYVKYNNNSGFVEYHAEGVEHAHRFTPHAFSRFTFF
ncbi:MAG: hypothetical protein SGPRY_011309, partial [Prymnesium sp.]